VSGGPLSEKVKPGRKKSATAKYQGDVNDQESDWPH
jgi:hypothetical protein